MTYPAKILLFGEHTVLRGSRALAVPFPRFGVKWQLQAGKTDSRLLDLYHYLKAEFKAQDFDFDRMETELIAGWQLSGNVPGGYGVGSSGTVCAAVYDRYGPEPKELSATRKFLAHMEGFYHGQSSGTDPLISLQQRPLLLTRGKVEPVALRPNWQRGLFLLDSGISREAGPLIDRFAATFERDFDWRSSMEHFWMPASDACIDFLLGKQKQQQLENLFSKLSRLQIALAPWLIPDNLKTIWSGKSYYLKLCGAGGGGFMLGYSTNWATTQQELNGHHIYKV